MSNRTQIISKTGFILILVLIFAVYGLSKAKNLWLGPKIFIDFPSDGATVSETDLQIKGQAQNISRLSLDGRQIFTDENGLFEENLLLARGYNIIELSAQDKFNREVKIKREVVLK